MATPLSRDRNREIRLVVPYDIMVQRDRKKGVMWFNMCPRNLIDPRLKFWIRSMKQLPGIERFGSPRRRLSASPHVNFCAR
jgi:hypothetical protein